MKEKVYFVSAPGRIKIGFTRRPEKRLVALRRADMEELSVIAIINGSRFLEKTLHDILKPYRLRGEWFIDCAEVRAEIGSAIDGAYPLEAEKKIKETISQPPIIIHEEIEEQEFSPQYEILAKLSDEAEAAIARNADKYEVRGRVQAFLAATQVYIDQRAKRQRKIEDLLGAHMPEREALA